MNKLHKIIIILSLLIQLITTKSTNFTPDYRTALKYSLLFYEAQRSGHLPERNRIKWRGDSALNDRGQNGEDLTGGYYDASDFVKFSFTMAFTTTLLTWGLLSFKNGYLIANQYNYGLDTIKWSTDYFLKCHIAPYEFYGQVGDFYLDHKYWGRPEDMNMSRPSYKIDKNHPGSELAGEVSAALSASSLIYQNISKNYTNLLLKHSIELFEFAINHRGLYHDSIPGAKIYYESTGYGDELTWAAIWLYKATKNITFLEMAENFYMQFRITDRPNEFFYNKKVAGIQLLLAEETLRQQYIDAIENFCDYSINDHIRTPGGLIFVEKAGTLSHAANIAFICLQAAIKLNIPGSNKYINFAKQQIDYMLGSNGRSFVVGYGENPPKQPHHVASSCPNRPEPCGWEQFQSKKPNPQILYGALISGPDQNDYYQDIREEFLYNEVTIDYNAGYQSVLAGLLQINNSVDYYELSDNERVELLKFLNL